MDDRGKVRRLPAMLERQREFHDHFASARRHNRRAEQGSILSLNHFNESLFVAFADSAVRLLHLPNAHLDGITEFAAGLFLGESNLSDLRVGERNPWKNFRKARVVSGEKSVSCRLKRLPSSEMGELVSAQNIPRRVAVSYTHLT